MAARNLSPGGALLRTSRMFSIPAPIRMPTDYEMASRTYSETSTTQFPTLLSVTTIPAARDQGDWGFKRPLPPKSTMRTSTPLIRVRQVDSIEQVTDFQSASDHTISLRKFQEMNMPITLPADKREGKPKQSVFDDDVDFTAIDPNKISEIQDKRWKFRGPWLAGLTEGEFLSFLKKARKRRPEFRQYLKEQLAMDMTQAATREATHMAEKLPDPVDASSITDDQLTDFLRGMRQAESRDRLYKLVGEFMDLAPLARPTKDLNIYNWKTPTKVPAPSATSNPYAAEGPPITHPSAGLSYLRTQSYLDNHPLYGPQEHHTPVRARIIVPRNAAGDEAKLGIGGFVTNAAGSTFYYRQERRGTNSSPMNTFDSQTPGGAKTFVEPEQAHVSSRGRLLLTVNQLVDEETELVWKEMHGEAKLYGQRRGGRKPIPSYERLRQRPDLKHNSRPLMGDRRTYGL